MKKTSLYLSLFLVGLVLVIQVRPAAPVKKEVRFEPAGESSIRVAVLADLHIDSNSDLENLISILPQVADSEPDLVVFLGDYSSLSHAAEFRENIVEALSILSDHPRIAILGNHDNLSDRAAWLAALRRAGIVVLENQSEAILTRAGLICVRGLGDYYSGQLRSTPWVEECKVLPKITITHDPAGVFKIGEPGFYLAGHTHCGQINLPILGALFIPSEVPKDAACGFFEERGVSLWVSSGIGTSLLNFRLGTKSEWDILEIPLTRLAKLNRLGLPFSKDR